MIFRSCSGPIRSAYGKRIVFSENSVRSFDEILQRDPLVQPFNTTIQYTLLARFDQCLQWDPAKGVHLQTTRWELLTILCAGHSSGVTLCRAAIFSLQKISLKKHFPIFDGHPVPPRTMKGCERVQRMMKGLKVKAISRRIQEQVELWREFFRGSAILCREFTWSPFSLSIQFVLSPWCYQLIGSMVSTWYNPLGPRVSVLSTWYNPLGTIDSIQSTQ